MNIPAGSIHLIQVAGGSINNTCKIITGNQTFFCKTNSSDEYPLLFDKEKNGLRILADTKIFRTPEVILQDQVNNVQILILEYIKQGIETVSFWKRFGEHLAGLHYTGSNYCGLEEDNYMGSLFQSNKKHSSWVSFFIEERISPQVKLAATKGLLQPKHFDQFERLYIRLTDIFPEERFSLLHGDLWSGNFLCDEAGMPVLIDPAVYYGSRHMDLAMTSLFGGFESPFYEAYRYHYPYSENYLKIWEICNLYPLLIHLNLFGNTYLPAINRIIGRF